MADISDDILREILDEIQKAGIPVRSESLKKAMDVAEEALKKTGKDFAQIRKDLNQYNRQLNLGTRDIRDMAGIIGQLNDSLKEVDETVSQEQRARTQAQIRELEREFTRKKMMSATGTALIELGKAAITAGMSITKSLYTNLTSSASGFKVAADVMTAQLDFTNQGVQSLGTAATSVGTGLVMLRGRAAAAGGALIIVGESAKFFSTALTDAAKFSVTFLAQEADKLISAFQTATAAGAVFANGMDGIRTAATEAGLTQEEFVNVLKNNNQLFAESGMTVAGTSRALGGVGKVLRETGMRDNLLRLGYNFEEIAGLSVQIMADMRKVGMRGSDREVAQATADYARNLRVIADITGEDARKRMEESRQAAMQYAFRAKVEEAARRTGDPMLFSKVTQAMAFMTETQRKAAIQSFVLGGAITDVSANLMGMGPAARQFGDAIESGNFDVRQSLGGFLEVNQRFANNTDQLGVSISAANIALGSYGDYARAYGEQFNMSTKLTADTIDKAIADARAAEAEKARAAGAAKSLTDTVVDIQKETQNMKMVIQTQVTESLKSFSKVVDTTIKEIARNLNKFGVAFDVSQGAAKVGTQPLGTLDTVKNSLFGMLDNITSIFDPNFRPLGTAPSATQIPGFATGGNPPVGQPYVVGERGPELKIDSTPSTVLPNFDLQPLQETMSELVELAKDQRDLQQQLLNNSY